MAISPPRFGTFPLIVYRTFFSRASMIYDAYSHETAGRWKTTGAPSNCYWAITTDPNGANIVENNFGAGAAYVDVQDG